ncbi:hypothetical protein NG796_15295 [Laspinema sp. A4]|uniref:hypothetical protein n=1 Tax=Laspinema sp. D2d TaxID=2953686 RepID=UPI0021BBB311|nr:hypothetical protein [Laspinema sp. D2d]MCT7984662.1 hypothetical protein [Laspinema sp. D2d]
MQRSNPQGVLGGDRFGTINNDFPPVNGMAVSVLLPSRFNPKLNRALLVQD